MCRRTITKMTETGARMVRESRRECFIAVGPQSEMEDMDVEHADDE